MSVVAGILGVWTMAHRRITDGIHPSTPYLITSRIRELVSPWPPNDATLHVGSFLEAVVCIVCYSIYMVVSTTHAPVLLYISSPVLPQCISEVHTTDENGQTAQDHAEGTLNSHVVEASSKRHASPFSGFSRLTLPVPPTTV